MVEQSFTVLSPSKGSAWRSLADMRTAADEQARPEAELTRTWALVAA